MMRNVLVFPDGLECDFMYPKNRDVEVGTNLKVDMVDESCHYMKVVEIKKTSRCIYYYLNYA